MPDIVVTLPKRFGIKRWIEEGDDPDTKWSGKYYEFGIGGVPSIEVGERVYVVYDRLLIGYAPLVEKRIEHTATGGHRTFLIRGGDARAVTIDEQVKSFRGYRYRWWNREDEKPFDNWREVLLGPDPHPDPATYIKGV